MVVHAISTADYHAMETAVEARGFKHDLSPEAPICRWVLHGIALDMMPSQPGTPARTDPPHARDRQHESITRKLRSDTSTIVQKLWNYCNFLRDDGMSYGAMAQFHASCEGPGNPYA